MGDMDDLIREFLVESYENLDQLDRDFVALETDPTATEKLGSIFRTIHTIKGTCGCLGFGKLESVAHVGENLLTRLRDGQLVMNKEITTALLQLVDAVREILSSIETTGSEGDKEYSAVKQKLITLNEQPAREPILAVSTPITPATTTELTDAHDDGAIDSPATPHSEKPNDSVAANAIRVDVVLLDKLMNLVGELVLARNQVLQYNAAQRDSTFLGTAQRLNLITTELQEGVMKTRMQPIGNLWNKFPRIVRDVANACNKKVRIEMEGRETELDKTILEAIKDPLTHVIRNSVDHGVESPDKRRASHKPEEGRLFLRAFHEGGQVNIEITDDGKGIDAEVVKRKAVERGLITAEQATRMSEREAINLIFLAGFSTAEKVTNVSGRGVGMDVVKTNVEKIGGTVDIKSRAGHGTTLRIKIPLTLAIIPALIVTSASERFAIPQVSLLELVRIEENETGIEFINGTPIYRLRGNLLPLVYLNQQLGLSAHNDESRSSHIVVLRGGERQFGLVVDQINDTEEIVVKPLGKQLKGLSVFAGATIMGDGGVALILDVMGLAQRANVISQAVDSHTHADTQAHNESLDCQTLLLFTLAGQRRMAIPLSLVARLEEIPRDAVEDAAGQAVVQYRGQIMPLLNLADFVGTGGCADPAGDNSTLQIIVHNHEGRNIGLRVEHILDVVEERVNMQRASNATGLMGSAVIKEKVTGLIDVRSILESAGELSAAA